MKYFIFFICLLLFIGVSFANDVNESYTSINTHTNVNPDNIEFNNQESKIIKETFTEDILNEEIEYDITNDLKEISEENENKIEVMNTESNEKSAQTFPTKHIYVNPNANINNQDGSSSHPFRNITVAVNNASDNYNNIIHLSAGNHFMPKLVIINKTIHIIGNSKTTTNITCNLSQGFKIKTSSNLTIEKVRMQKSNATQGAAILAETNAMININDCIFNNNTARNGAVLFSSGTGVKSNITNTRFEKNTDEIYGLLHLAGSYSVFNVKNCYFTDNIVTANEFSGKSGGAAIIQVTMQP